MKNGLLIMLAAALFGCAVPPPQMSREEALIATQRHYPGVTQGQILQRVESIFDLSDGSDYTYAYTSDGLKANRRYDVYLVFIAPSGNFIWDVRATPDQDGVLVKAQVEEHSGGIGIQTGTELFNTAIPYNMLWERLDYLLGKSDHWPTCDEAKAAVGNKPLYVNQLRPWCFYTDDKRPD